MITDIITVVIAAVALLNFFVLLLLLTQIKRTPDRLAFLMSNIFVIAWTVGAGILLVSSTVSIALIGLNIFYLAPMLMMISLSVFSENFNAGNNKPSLGAGTMLVTGMTLVGFVAILSVPNLLEISLSVRESTYNKFSPNSLYVMYAAYFSVAFMVIFRNLYARYKATRGVHRKQTLYVLAGMAASSGIASITNLLLPVLGCTDYIWVGPTATLFYILTVTISIIRHGLFDIKLAAVRSLAYVLSLLTLAAVYYIVAYLISVAVFQGQVNNSFSVSPLNIILALALAFIFQPIKQFFDRITDAVFYRDRYDSDAFMARVGEALTSTTNLHTLLRRVGDEIATTLKAQHATFVVMREDTSPLTMGSAEYIRLKAAEVQQLSELYDAPDIYMRESDDTHAELDKWLQKRSLYIMLPLDNNVGWLLLGEPKTGAYTARDIRVLQAISSELTIAIQNARSVQVVKELNAHLQQRIDAATRELRDTNEKLRKLDETKDEFVSMASHQLRTPLTSVKGYISMLLEGDGGKITKQQQKLLNEAFTSSERMVRLISDFLNVSRLQTGKFMIDAQPIDLARVIGDEIESMRLMAKAHGQTLHYDGPDSLPDVMIDEDKTRQVIMNFIDNAIYYSPEGTDIVMKLHTARGRVVFEVHDRGIGVPKDEQAQLFTKFFRAANARRQRPDGTGVGLYLAKKVIEAQGGEIIFHSRPGMGSVFGFKLPLKR